MKNEREYTFEELAEIAANSGLNSISKRNVGQWAKDNGYIKKQRLINYYVKLDTEDND